MTEGWDTREYDRDFAFVSAYGAELLDWLNPQPGETVLDLGCGTGELAAKIAGTGATVIGIDSDPAMIEAARQRLPDADLRVADAHDFTVEQPVDAVFSNAALHWMPSSVEVLGCVSDALRGGGRFIAEMGATGNVAAITGASPAQYAAMLEDAGFEIRELDFRDRPTRLTGDDGLVRWLQMFAGGVLADVPPEVLARGAEIARPQLWRDGAWWADYRRLRFRAVKVS